MRTPAITVILTDTIDAQAVGLEDYPIFDFDPQDLPKCLKHSFVVWIAEAEKIDVPRRSRGIVELRDKQHGPLEHEAFRVLGFRKTVKYRSSANLVRTRSKI